MMDNPYINSAIGHADEIPFHGADPGPHHTQATIAYALLAIAWELHQQRESQTNDSANLAALAACVNHVSEDEQ